MSATSLPYDADLGPHMRRTQTRETTSSGRKASPKPLKSKPDDHAVISSIISSLDTFDPTTGFSEGYYSHIGSNEDSRSRSPGTSAASSPSIIRSSFMPRPDTIAHGNGPNGGAEWEYIHQNDAAPPPVVPASPSVSTLSQQSLRPSRPSIRTATPSLHSLQRSPVSAKEEPLHSSNKDLSAESWIKQNIQQSLESAQARKQLSPSVRQSETRPGDPSKHHLAACAIKPAASRSRHMSGEVRRKESTRAQSSRGRVFLDSDSPDEKDPRPPTPKSLSIRTKSNESYKDAINEASPNLGMSPQASPRRSPMADSIPLRTSSLRQSSSSPAPMKRKPKSSRRENITSNPFKSKRSEPISDNSFLDLGEEDETVKRIMELRKKRQSRLLESHTESPLTVDVPPAMPSLSANAIPTGGYNAGALADLQRPTPGRSFTEPVHVPEGLGINTAPAVLNDLNESPTLGGMYSPDTGKPRAQYFEPLSPHSMPGTVTTSPQTSLDFSYAQAVHALHNASSGASSFETTRPSIEAAMPTVPFRRGSTATSSSTGKASSLQIPSLRKTRSKRSSQSRWAHPDLPDDLPQKKQPRRKSISDTRNAKVVEEQMQMERRDSIEDAVLGFLRAQRLNQKIRHMVSGRTISFSEVGDPKGSAVIVCVGMGLTRFVTAFYDELATTLRLRLVTIERPGVGESDGYPPNDRSGPLNWPNDVLTVCDHLGIDSFSLLAHSAGAVYALATALVLPHMVKGKVHLLAPWIPPSQMETVSQHAVSTVPAAVLPRSQRLLRVLPTPFLRAANSSFMASASASLNKSTNKRKPSGAGPWPSSPEHADFHSRSQSAKRPTTSGADRPDFHRRESLMLMDQYMPTDNPMENFPIRGGRRSVSPDKRESLFMSATATPMDPAFTYASTALNAAEHAERERSVIYTSRLTQRTWEYAIRDSNPATDLLVCLERHREVGFRYTDIDADVIITHGAEDKRVPVSNIRWLGDQMNRAGSRGGPSGHGLGRGGGCEVRVMEDEGHGLMASPAIMGDLLTEISGYWREKSYVL